MRKQKKYIVLFAIIMFILLNGKVFANEFEIEYSKKYLEWMELSDEEKEGTIAPFPTNITLPENNRASKLNMSLKASILPEKYDLRDYIDIEVKDQGLTDSCWTYAGNSVLETYLALHNENYNFSERHIEYNTATNFINGNNSEAVNNRTIGSGGEEKVFSTYYSRGSGPVLEEDMPFENNEKEMYLEDLPKENAVKQVENIKYFPNIYKKYDNNGNLVCTDGNGKIYTESQVDSIREDIKKHIMNYGGISAAVYMSYNSNVYYNSTNYSSYVKETSNANHAVTIIGWDDTYSKDNFNYKPSSDGAYIALNSAGENWGDNGYYYISYEDMWVEFQLAGVTSISDVDYDNIYQYDLDKLEGNLPGLSYSANVFTSTADEYLTEIVIGTLKSQTYDIYINKSGNDLNINNLTKVASNVTLNAGYNTIKLTDKVELTSGQQFAIVVKTTSSDGSGVGISSKDGDLSSNKGQSYASLDGENWQDLAVLRILDKGYMKLSIKALTQTKGKHISVSSNLRSNSDGTRINVTLSTSHLENGNTVNIQIMHKGYDVTKEFTISGNTIRGKGAFVKIIPINDIDTGTYTINVKLSNFKTLVQNLTLDEDNSKLNSGVYYIYNGYIMGIEANTKVSKFKNNIETDLNYSITENNGGVVSDENGLIKTGQIIIEDGNTYYLVVTGDLNGDGKVKASDLSVMKSYIVGKRALIGAATKAGDLNFDEKIRASDISLLKKIIIGN